VRQPPILQATLNGLKSPDGAKGIDSVMYIADFPPGSVSALHSHPGWEFNYILKGAITFEVVGKAPYTLKAGEGMYNQRGNVHTVRNASQTEPAQLLSVLVKDVGAPVAINAF
jgi:quercetin dioxygenase-like cupin family protein